MWLSWLPMGASLLLLSSKMVWTQMVMAERYVAFDPPRIIPRADSQTVKAGGQYSFRCEGHDPRGLAWRLPVDADDNLRDRLTLSQRREEDSSRTLYVSELTLRDLVYSDTGTFVCAYNGTTDISAIDTASRVHLYVEDGVHLLKHTGVDFFSAEQAGTFVIPCLPTHPDANVSLSREGQHVSVGNNQDEDNNFITYDPRIGFRISPVTFEQHSGAFQCRATLHSLSATYTASLRVLKRTHFVPAPQINRTQARHAQIGADFGLICTVTIDPDTMVDLQWETPTNNHENRIQMEPTMRNLSLGQSQLIVVEKRLKVINAQLDDQGAYTCHVEDHSGNRKSTRTFIRVTEKEEPYIRLYYDGAPVLDKKEGDQPVQWVIHFESLPEPQIEWFDARNRPIKIDNAGENDIIVRTRRREERKWMSVLRINNVNLENAGYYRVKASNGHETREERFKLVVQAPPKIEASVQNARSLYSLGHEYLIKCSARGYPRPRIQFMFKNCRFYDDCDSSSQNRHLHYELEPQMHTSSYTKRATLHHVASASGQIICQACNKHACDFETIPFFVTDIKNGFYLSENDDREVVEGDQIQLRCDASIYDYEPDSMNWIKRDTQGERLISSNDRVTIEHRNTELSFGQTLNLANATLSDRGSYTCRVRRRNHNSNLPLGDLRRVSLHTFGSVAKLESSLAKLSRSIAVLSLRKPKIEVSNLRQTETLVPRSESGLRLECRFEGRPQPSVVWTLNNEEIKETFNTTRIRLLHNKAVLALSYFTERDEGLYECTGSNRAGNASTWQMVRLKASAERDVLYANMSIPFILAVLVAVLFVLLLTVMAKLCCFSAGRKKGSNATMMSSWSEERHRAPTPPSPRLTQFDMPDDDCHVALTSGAKSREGSISPSYTTHLQHPSVMNGSGLCVASCYTPPLYLPSHHNGFDTLPNNGSYQPFLASKCSLCDWHTMPKTMLHPMRPVATENEQREEMPQVNEQERNESPPLAPRLSAEF